MLCRGGDVPLSVEHIRYYAGWADKIHGKIVPTGGKFYAQVYKEPLGKGPLAMSVLPAACAYLICCMICKRAVYWVLLFQQEALS